MKTSKFENFIDELLDTNTKRNSIADDVGNYLFSMSLDVNHEANLALKKHFEEQQKNLTNIKK